ncbi:MAG: DEAD/DEAH box helicase [Bdellovibrionota bacterium]
MSFTLTECQQNAMELLNKSENIFLTGVAGSGKSFLLQHFLKDKNSKTHPVVASTGAAAVLVKGVTFHSFFGLGILEGGPEKTIQRALKDGRLKKRINTVDTIIIDEISMIPGVAFEVAENICREVRKSQVPWGGIRIIAVGDFGQLPPVSIGGKEKDWAFQNHTWENSNFQVAYLKTIMRSTDEKFLRVLNFIRNGQVNFEVNEFLNSKIKKPTDDFTGTILFSHRNSVEDYNLTKLSNLKGDLLTFKTAYSGSSKFLEAIKKASPVPEVLQLKIGALVMIRKNDPQGAYVNGTLGTVKSAKEGELRVEMLNGNTAKLEPETFSYMNAEGEVVAAAENFPVNLAWATTIHKSQGITLDAATIDLSRVFEAGQAYVALSRVKSSDALFLSGWNPNAIRASAEVKNFHSQILKDL